MSSVVAASMPPSSGRFLRPDKTMSDESESPKAPQRERSSAGQIHCQESVDGMLDKSCCDQPVCSSTRRSSTAALARAM